MSRLVSAFTFLTSALSHSTPPILAHPDSFQTLSSLPNSCIGMPDGEYWFLLSTSSDSYLPVHLSCSNEYIILDVNKDPNLKKYFSTFEKWHHSIGGPANGDPVTWEEWFLHRDIDEQIDDHSESSYLISPDCSLCDETADKQIYNTKTSYWMTGNLAKLHWGVIGFNECDMDYNTYQCYSCLSCMIIGDGCNPEPYNELTTDYTYAGICGVTVEKSNHEIYKQRKIAQFASGSINYKPSIGTSGEFCMCYKPKQLKFFDINDEQMNVMENREMLRLKGNHNNHDNIMIMNSEGEEEDMIIETVDKNVFEGKKDMREFRKIYLSQKDFEKGTYRIKQSGTYIIAEDIEFNFNKNDDWWPTTTQQDEYPGAGTYRDPYHLGFFAGITVETDYVTIDLNGKELKQSLQFYYQQRWFAIIELGNQQFLPGQGPAFFGPDPVTVSDVSIIDGTLGRTSHFAIHGNYPTNLIIDNVHIKEFVTHGLQLNGWKNVVINNVEVGPSSQIEYLKGDYAHGRIIQQRLRAIENNMIDDGSLDKSEIEFAYHENSLYYRSGGNKPLSVSISDIADELDIQMLLAFDYAMNRANNQKYKENGYISPEYFNNDDIYTPQRMKEVKDTFIHESGLPSSSSITGLFLNFEGASVFSYTMYTTHQSSNAYLNNVYIHDIYHDMVESTRMSKQGASGQLYPTPWNSDIAAEYLMGGDKSMLEVYNILQDYSDDLETQSTLLSSYKYIGTIMTDAYFAMAQFSDDWGILGFLQVEGVQGEMSLFNWVQGKGNIESDWLFGCNQDIMGHSGKGLLGLRLDGVINVEINNIIIENLYEYSSMGSYACGEYSVFTPQNSGGHFKQSLPTQYGFSGNDLQAISIISSTNVILGNIYISTLHNDYSQAFGLSFWTANDITIKDNSLVVVKDIIAGDRLQLGKLSYQDKPNRAPESCGVRLETNTQKGDNLEMYESEIVIENEEMIHVCGLEGHVKCLGGINNGQDDKYTMFGIEQNIDICNNLMWTDDLGALQWLRFVLEHGEKINTNTNMNEMKTYLKQWENMDDINENNEINDNVDSIRKKVVRNIKGIKNDMERGTNEGDGVLYQMSALVFAVIIIGVLGILICCARGIGWCINIIKNKYDENGSDKIIEEYGSSGLNSINNNGLKIGKEIRSSYGDYLDDNGKCENGNETYIGIYGAIKR